MTETSKPRQLRSDVWQTVNERYPESMISKDDYVQLAVLDKPLNEAKLTFISSATDDIHDLVSDLVDEVEEFEDLSYQNADDLLEKVAAFDFLFAYRQGEQAAKVRVAKEEERAKEYRKGIEAEKRELQKFWPLLEKKYRLLHGQAMPKKIEKSNYGPFKLFLERESVTKHQRLLIANYAPVPLSNSVRELLGLK